MVSFNGKNLKYNGHDITFMHVINEVMETPQGCLVLLKWNQHGPSRNVFLVAPDGSVKWQIQMIGDPNFPSIRPYAGIRIKDGIVRVYNIIGMECALNLDDGTISDCRVTK